MATTTEIQAQQQFLHQTIDDLRIELLDIQLRIQHCDIDLDALESKVD